MILIDTSSSVAIYEQIYDEFVKLIVHNIMKEGEKLPSVRELALSLQINPNTIQKAYKMLESKSFVKSEKGKGNFVNNMNESRDFYKGELKSDLKKVIKELFNIGLDKKEILEIVNIIIESENNKC